MQHIQIGLFFKVRTDVSGTNNDNNEVFVRHLAPGAPPQFLHPQQKCPSQPNPMRFTAWQSTGPQRENSNTGTIKAQQYSTHCIPSVTNYS